MRYSKYIQIYILNIYCHRNLIFLTCIVKNICCTFIAFHFQYYLCPIRWSSQDHIFLISFIGLLKKNRIVALKPFISFQKQPTEVFFKKGVLRNFAKFTGKHLLQSPFLNEVAGPEPAILLKKILCHRFFPVNFAKFLRKSFLHNTSGQPLLSF